jgi:hypothetical protein
MALISSGYWNVRTTTEAALWHRVKSFSAVSSGRTNQAHTFCGITYDFPTDNTVFSEYTGEDKHLCTECYSEHE